MAKKKYIWISAGTIAVALALLLSIPNTKIQTSGDIHCIHCTSYFNVTPGSNVCFNLSFIELSQKIGTNVYLYKNKWNEINLNNFCMDAKTKYQFMIKANKPKNSKVKWGSKALKIDPYWDTGIESDRIYIDTAQTMTSMKSNKLSSINQDSQIVGFYLDDSTSLTSTLFDSNDNVINGVFANYSDDGAWEFGADTGIDGLNEYKYIFDSNLLFTDETDIFVQGIDQIYRIDLSGICTKENSQCTISINEDSTEATLDFYSDRIIDPTIVIYIPQKGVSFNSQQYVNTSFFIANTTITTANLTSIIYNFNGTNFSIYDSSLILFYSFDTVTPFQTMNTTYWNGGFELNLSNQFNNWTYTINVPATSNITVSNNSHSGNNSCAFWINAAADNVQIASPNNVLIQGRNYLVTYWAMDNLSTGSLQTVVGANNHNGATLSNTTWTQQNWTLPALVGGAVSFKRTPATSFNDTIYLDDIVIYDVSEATPIDYSLYGNNATSLNVTTNSSCISGNCSSYNGKSSKVNILNLPSINTTTNWTMSAWINIQGGTQGGIIDIAPVSGNRNGIVYTTSNLGCGWYNGSDVAGWLMTSAPTKNLWYYITCINANGIPSLYANGVNQTATGFGNIGFDMAIGYNGNAGYFNGTIDEVRIWNRTLTSQEITEQYNSMLSQINSGVWNFKSNQTNLLDRLYPYTFYSTDLSGSIYLGMNITVDTTIPVCNYTNPTPTNNAIVSNFFAIINTSIIEANLFNLSYTWNKTNYSFYDSTLVSSYGFNDANNTQVIGPTVNNGGFETTGLPTSLFASWYNQTAGTSNVTDETVIVHSGSHAAKLSTDSNNSYVGIQINNLLIINHTYIYTMWARGSVGGEIIQYGDANTPLVAVLTTSYSQYTQTFTAVTTTPIVKRAAASEVFYIDDVTLTDITLKNISDDSLYNNNAVVWNITYTPNGIFGGGYTFYGNQNDSYVNLGTLNSVLANQTKYTISMWFNTLDFTKRNYSAPLFMRGSSGAIVGFLMIMGYSNNQISFDIANFTDSHVIAFTAGLSNNTWYHVVAVSDNLSALLYINGTLVSNISLGFQGAKPLATLSGTNLQNSGSFVGMTYYNSATTENFNGTIDEVKIWNRALSPSEIKQLYQYDLIEYPLGQYSIVLNETGLMNSSSYSYQVFAKDIVGWTNATELRSFTVDNTTVSNSTGCNYLCSDNKVLGTTDCQGSNLIITGAGTFKGNMINYANITINNPSGLCNAWIKY